MAQRVQLRRLLPKPATDTQQEVSLPVPLSDHLAVLTSSETSGPQSIKPSQRSLGQKRRREREARENSRPVESESSKTRRSVAQKARRQRELAASIEQDMSSERQRCDPDLRSKAQKFRRRVEAAERRLELAPDCDPTQALEHILHYNYDNWSRHRRESYRDRMQRVYGNCNYH
ncbi:hypothetical protein B0H12DRAFT_1116103 [Mycena haematopus]|nr:hypothetical protein B0H12DRAFT_1154779 [Mycena haematopus]KAJ7253668.1 hypothetical protein B0H12DRAFT_1116103 [Mycena haematopus]